MLTCKIQLTGMLACKIQLTGMLTCKGVVAGGGGIGQAWRADAVNWCGVVCGEVRSTLQYGAVWCGEVRSTSLQ